MRKKSFNRRTGMSSFLIFLTLILYVTGAVIVYRNEDVISVRSRIPADDGAGVTEFAALYSGEYFKEAAERQQYRAHDPREVDELFRTAVCKSPANYRIMHAYARYLASRNCCVSRASALFREAQKRAPFDISVHSAAASFFWNSGQRVEALSIFRQLIESHPGTESGIRRWLLKNGATEAELASLTGD